MGKEKAGNSALFVRYVFQ